LDPVVRAQQRVVIVDPPEDEPETPVARLWIVRAVI
jgi:hypothetical protein